MDRCQEIQAALGRWELPKAEGGFFFFLLASTKKWKTQVYMAKGQISCLVSDAEKKKFTLAFLALRGFVRIPCLAMSGI